MKQMSIDMILSQDKWLGKQVREWTFREYIGTYLGKYSSKQMKKAYSKTTRAFPRKARRMLTDTLSKISLALIAEGFIEKNCETVFHTVIKETNKMLPLFEGEWEQYDKELVGLRLFEMFTLIVSWNLSEDKALREELGVEKIILP